jgi:RNA polymerase sigma factor (TIGR02999 family)
MNSPEANEGAPDVTQFLKAIGRSNDAEARVMPFVYGELKAIAKACLHNQNPGNSLQPTALVHEAFLKLFGREDLDLQDRKHFFRLAAMAMRQILIDSSRARRRLKRGGDQAAISLDEAIGAAAGIDFDWIDLDQALTELAERDERQARIVELRYFGGLDLSEVADNMDLSKSTAEREWRSARVWLGVRLEDGSA